jgi:flagellar biosynthesis GTPase FlhF
VASSSTLLGSASEKETPEGPVWASKSAKKNAWNRKRQKAKDAERKAAVAARARLDDEKRAVSEALHRESVEVGMEMMQTRAEVAWSNWFMEMALSKEPERAVVLARVELGSIKSAFARVEDVGLQL